MPTCRSIVPKLSRLPRRAAASGQQNMGAVGKRQGRQPLPALPWLGLALRGAPCTVIRRLTRRAAVVRGSDELLWPCDLAPSQMR